MALDDLLLYLRSNDVIVVDDASSRGLGYAGVVQLVEAMRDAVARGFVERWATIQAPINLAQTDPEWLRDRAVGVELTEAGRQRVARLFALLHTKAAAMSGPNQPAAGTLLTYDELMSRLSGD